MNYRSILRLSTIGMALSAAQAAPLLTDSFDDANFDASTFNNNLAATQGGSLAPISYSVFAPGGGYTVQHGNGGKMLVVGNGGIQGGRASLNRNFAIEANLADKPLSISFNLAEVTHSGDPQVWGHFGLGSSQNADYFGTDFAILFRSNGNWISRDNNAAADLGSGTYADGDLITFVFSNTAGTGSAFNGNGSKVTITVGAAVPVTQTLNQLSAADGFPTWGGFPYYQEFMVTAIDNLSVDMDATFPSGESMVWAGSVDANWDEATANWTNVNSFTKWFNHPGTPNNALFDATGSSQPNITLALGRPLEAGTLTFETAGYNLGGAAILAESPTVIANADATISATLQGAVNLTKSGPAKLTLGANSSYTGNTNVTHGVLEVASTGKLYSGGYTALPTVTVDGGTVLRLNGWDYDTAGSLGGLDFSRLRLVVNGGTIEYVGGSNSTVGGAAGRNFTVGTGGATLKASSGSGQLWFIAANTLFGYGNLVNNETLTLDGAGAGEIQKVIQGSGSIVKTGPGTWTLSGANTYTGTTTISGGTLSLTSPSLDIASSVVIGLGATLNLDFSGNDVVSGLEINGSGPLAAGVYNSSHPVYGSYFTGSGTLLVVNGADGQWTSLADGDWEEPANWATNTIATGFDKTATFNAATGATVTLNSGLTIGNLAFDVSDYTIAGALLTLDSSSTPAINVASGRTATITAGLAGVYGMQKTGAGTLVLTAPNNYSGETLVTGGLLQLGANPVSNPQFGALENSYVLTIESGATVRAMGANAFKGWSGGSMELTLNGGTLTINDGATEGGNHALGNVILNGGAITGVGNSTYGGFNLNGMLTVTDDSTISVSHINTGNANRTVDVAAGKTLDWSGLISNGSAVGTTSLTFEGLGTTVFSGANTYTGNTVVNSGLLQLTSTSQMQFVVTDAPASNLIGGTGTVSFDGVFNINTSAVAGSAGYIWLLVDRTSLSGESFGSNFSVAGFTPQVDGVTWTMSDSRGTWTFSEDTGELTLDIGNDYDTWKADNGVTGGPNDDDDNDGLSNHEEYAFGLDPTGGSSVNPIAVQLDKTTGSFSYTRRLQTLTGLTYSIWYSTDLATWTEDTGALAGTSTVNGDVETVPVTISSSLLTNPKLFVQVRAN